MLFIALPQRGIRSMPLSLSSTADSLRFASSFNKLDPQSESTHPPIVYFAPLSSFFPENLKNLHLLIPFSFLFPYVVAFLLEPLQLPGRQKRICRWILALDFHDSVSFSKIFFLREEDFLNSPLLFSPNPVYRQKLDRFDPLAR